MSDPTPGSYSIGRQLQAMLHLQLSDQCRVDLDMKNVYLVFFSVSQSTAKCNSDVQTGNLIPTSRCMADYYPTWKVCESTEARIRPIISRYGRVCISHPHSVDARSI